jgi:hypothetical protein
MTDFRAVLVNAVFTGEEWTEQPDGSSVRNVIRLQLDGRQIELVQAPELFGSNKSELRGQQVETTTLVVKDVPAADVPVALDLANGVASLLSVATCSEVRVCAYDHPEANPYRRTWAVVGSTWRFCPTIETADGARVRRFLEQCWPQYRLLREERMLDVVFDYFVVSQKPGYPIELRLITSFVLLENLKHTFAKQAGYPFLKGRFRKRGATLKRHGNEVLGFERLLGEMLRTVGMTNPLVSIVKLRNELIHSGVASLSFEEHQAILADAQDLIREYLLRLLAYRGPYSPYSAPNSEKTLP